MPRKPQQHKPSSRKPTISIVGPGRLGSALAVALHAAGYKVEELVARTPGKARRVAHAIGAPSVSLDRASLDSDIIWLTVGDSAIRTAAQELAANRADWTGQFAFHASGALTSDQLSILKSRGAAVASVHPLMTFSGGKPPALVDVTFALEGDPRAIRAASAIVRALGGLPIRIKPEHKAAYHAWASLASPLLIALLAATERVGALAGIDAALARRAIAPLARQTLDNYVAQGAAMAFTGPLVRGDIDTIRKHLEALRAVPAAQSIYIALATAALNLLPVANATKIAAELNEAGSTSGRSAAF